MPTPAETMLTLGFKEQGYGQWLWSVPGEYGLVVLVHLSRYGLPRFAMALPETEVTETDPYLLLAEVRLMQTECRRAYDMLARVAGLAQQIREGLDG
jgi:hypothetical protein